MCASAEECQVLRCVREIHLRKPFKSFGFGGEIHYRVGQLREAPQVRAFAASFVCEFVDRDWNFFDGWSITAKAKWNLPFLVGTIEAKTVTWIIRYDKSWKSDCAHPNIRK